ncbi:MAG: type I secretion system permease/ATPase [Desulfobacula sp.]|nr:type I secretion system permease/ATPase [Desulfobacula sp.]
MLKWLKYFFFAGFFSLFINLLYLTFPIYMLAIYDRVLSSYSMPTLMTITAAALFALLIFGLLDFLRSRLLVMAGVDMDKTLSSPVFSEMVKDASSLQKVGHDSGLRDVNILRNYFAGNAILAIFDIPWSPIFLGIIYFMHPVMGMVATGGALAVIVLGLAQEFLTRNKLSAATQQSAKTQAFVSSAMRNSESVQCMGMLPGILSHWQKGNDVVLDLQTGASRHAGLLQSATKAINSSMQVLIYGVGAWLTLKNECTPGIMISSSIIMGRALAPIQQGMATWKMTVDARGAYQRLSRLISANANLEKMSLPDPKGKLDVEGITLAIGGRYVLRNITLKLNPGESLGLIGPSAAGKTTLCRVLLGLWESAGGKVRLDGADIFSWDSDELGKFIGYLPQDVELFPGTVKDNIARMGEPDSDKVVEAAQKAGVHELILNLPEGYDTYIGGSAANLLSGGQRQRVALARAIYGTPKFVILDEPNSNLDEIGEQALMQSLQRLRQEEITTIIVTHKPTILSSVDKILMIKDGQVVMFGPRQEVFKALSGQAAKKNV